MCDKEKGKHTAVLLDKCHGTVTVKYVGYSESKHRLRISLAHPRDCHFAHVQ